MSDTVFLLLKIFIIIYAAILTVYFLTGLVLEQCINKLPSSKFLKIQNRQCPEWIIIRDIKTSIVELATISLLITIGHVIQLQIVSISSNAWPFIIQFILSIILYETSFYWAHRLIHTKILYKRVHFFHHVSRTPVSWSSDSNSLLDSLISNSSWLIAAILFDVRVILLHKLIDQVLIMTGHSGYEHSVRIYPNNLRILSTVTFHDQHHEYYKYNYGNVTTIWDRCMGTVSPNYEKRLFFFINWCAQNVTRHVLITEGSERIDFALAKKYVEHGFNITLIAHNLQKLEQTKAFLESLKIVTQQKIYIEAANISDYEALSLACQKAIKLLGPVYVAIMSTGACCPGDFLETLRDVFVDTMSINYMRTINVIKALQDSMLEHKSGHLVIISSLAKVIPTYGHSAYSATKFALAGLAEMLRCELKNHGIFVSIVFPPNLETNTQFGGTQYISSDNKAFSAFSKIMPIDKVANIIFLGIKKKQSHILMGLESKFAWYLPPIAYYIIYKYFDIILAIKKKRAIKQ